MDINQLSLREKIGQTMVTLCTPEKFDAVCGNSEEFIKRYPIGGMFPSRDLNKGALTTVGVEEFNKIMMEYNRYSRIPLIAAADGPNDIVEGQLQFGHAMLMGATNDPQLAYEYGKIMGARMSACGIHWWFAPVVDLDLSPESPVTNVRAVSDDPDLAVKITKEIIRGIQESGVAATAKHFPGGDDKKSVDPHLAPVSNCISKEKWEQTTGKVFRELFKEDIWSVMISHTNLVSYQTETINGKYPPSTMSKEVVTDLLRGQLGYDGVVVTDALVMGGFAGTSGVRNQVKSFEAGNDVALWPELEYMDVMEKEILNGNIPMERLDDAVRRILALKEKLGLLDGSFERKKYNPAAAQENNRKICEKGITLVQDPIGIIPAKDVGKVLVVGVTPDDGCYAHLEKLKNIFSDYGIHADIRRDISEGELAEAEKAYDLIIFALNRQIHKPIGPLSFWGENALSIWASNSGDKKKQVIVSFGDPYGFRYYKETDAAYINAYTAEDEMLKTFVRGLIGKIPFCGKSPVNFKDI